ncbi:MAG TPA: class I SAM-dependent methyltransferase [Oligoflexia bacterium]|nr:class I SAM-dependent methyltransferase [Oligoflexia bacterium]HMP26468.1 class I SAM-dependent methyltransferase [Oligoflexia bacterium]
MKDNLADLSGQLQFNQNTQIDHQEIDLKNLKTANGSFDIPAIMAVIRDRVKQSLTSTAPSKKITFQPSQFDFNGKSARQAGELVGSEELRLLNAEFALASEFDFSRITSHRKGVIGKIIVKIKRWLLRSILDFIKTTHFIPSRDFAANLIRFLNDTSKYIDARDAASFWELIRKIDVDNTKLIEKIERVTVDQMGALRATEQDLSSKIYGDLKQLRADLDRSQGRLAEIDSLSSTILGLEGILARLSKLSAEQNQSYASKGSALADQKNLSNSDQHLLEKIQADDLSYLLLENRFRGGEDAIREHAKVYLQYFAGVSGKILDIGCGRGELLSLLKENGIEAYGMELDGAMQKICLDKGLKVELGDGIAHLETLADDSLAGLIAMQVVEHLPQHQLSRLIKLAAHKVRRGGRVIFETINPRSLIALSSNYFRDPTHLSPLHPDTLAYAAELCGLKVIEIRYLSEIASASKLQPITPEDAMPFRTFAALETYNQNMAKLNEIIFGPQDYAIIAEAP